MKRTLLIILLLFGLQTFAIQPATLKCIEVNNAGDAIITWQGTTDIADFVSYQLYFSNTAAGPFSLLTTINTPATITYTHIGAAADLNNCFYYIKTEGSSSTGFSDTLQSIQLVITNNNDGNAQLQWNSPSTPLPSANNWYRVYKEYPAGIWNVIDSTPNINYFENFSLCDAQVSYKIEMTGSGCTNLSALDGTHIKDLLPPDTPALDSVSINPANGNVNIGWQPSIASDTKGYIIYIQQGGVWTPIDTVYGMTNTAYFYSNPDAQTSPQNYRIAALDSCLNASPLSSDQHSMVLSYATNTCQLTASLSWNAYDNISGGIEKYEIYMAINGGAFIKVDEVIGAQNYTYSGLIHNSNYRFFIRVVGNSGITASSTISSFLFLQTNLPKSVYFRYASVNEQQDVNLAVYVDTTATITNVLIYKQYPNTTYVLLATLPYNATGLYYFTDGDVATFKESYNYFARITDNCGNEVLYSDTVRTILLTGMGNSNHTNSISWIPYHEFNVPIEDYLIYRSIGTSLNFDSVGFTNASVHNYTEDVTPYERDGAIFNYYVEAVESNGNLYGFKDFSRSNTIKATQLSMTFIPNAFAPSGENKIFKPSNIFIDAENYVFLIYGRSGGKLFETHDPNSGWDGTLNGELLPGGIYCYRLSYTATDGTSFEKEGWIALVR
jgi:gliding motility-associated-like protein